MSNSNILDLLKSAAEDRLFTAASVIISRGEDVLFEAHTGYEEENGLPVTCNHLFDLASLTKPIVTATAFMKLCSDGILTLDEPLHYFFPSKRIHPDLRNVPLRAILSHAGGWKDYEPFYLALPANRDRETAKNYILRAILETPPAYTPLKQSCYSDLGYILLGFILEEIKGVKLDVLWTDICRTLCPEPNLIYLSKENLQSHRIDILTVSTGWCSWRKRWLKGEVHDENCFAMGGIAGHAGLFGTAQAVSGWLKELFRTWSGNSPRLPIKKDIVRSFWERRKEIPNSTWALGFDTPSTQNSTAGRFFSQTSVGHLGFTGTSFWLDLTDGFSVVLLTNRVYYPGTKDRMKLFRMAIHDLARTEYGGN
ncbi:MAG: serine hydrolase domain-containing protein [Thermodesulforhabdaceae bacterium]